MNKKTMNAEELIKALLAQQTTKRDYIVPANCLAMFDGNLQIKNITGASALDGILRSAGVATAGSLELAPSEICHEQIAEKLQIPRAYYKRMIKDALDLLDINATYWFRDDGEDNYLLRTFTNNDPNQIGIARALLSSRYKMIDNLDVLTAATEAIRQHAQGSQITVESADITDKRMYVRFIAPEIQINSPELLRLYRVPNTGDNGNTGIVAGFILQNSETGYSRFSVAPRVIISACKNGNIYKSDQFARTHLGAELEPGVIQWSEETKKKNLELIMEQVKDAVRTFLSPEYLGQCVQKMLIAGGIELQHPQEAVVNVCEHYDIKDAEKILGYLIKGGDNTGFGLNQALTYYAGQDAPADAQYEIEIAATDMLDKIPQFDKP